MNRTIAGPVFAALLFAGRAAGAPPAPASPWDVAARLEARLAAGDGMMQPDADAQFVQHAGTIGLSGDAWPAEFLAREGETICVAVSPFTGHYEFFDESGEVFWTLVPVLPTTDNWVAPFRHAEPGAFPDDELYASWRLVDMWTLSRAESAKFVSHAENAETLVTRRSSLVARGAASPATNLCFTAIACTETNFCFTAAWPANEPLPESVLDLYGSSNLSARTWTLLSSHPAATPPVSFAVDPAALPWHVAPTQHVHGVSCVSLTNVVLSPLDGTTVYTNVFWSCSTNRAPDEAGFFRLGTRHETDGDGLSDAFELLVSATDPATADTDGDGVPDGQTAAQWLSHPLWAENGDGANLVVSLYEPITNGAAALLFDDLCIPLSSNAGPWSLCIPTNTVVTCKLVAAPGTVVMLWYGPPEAAAQTRSAAPDWTVPPFVATPLWCDDPSAVFGGNDWGGGTCRFARPVLLVDGYPPFFSAPLCYHDPGEAEYEWSVLPAICESTLEPSSSGYVDFDETDGTFWLDLRYASPGPENNREGTFRLEGGSPFFGENVLFGDLSATLAGHVCVAGLHSACRACGAHHGNDPDFRCFHLDWCASKTSATADCNCAEPFVRIGRTNAWRLVGPDLCCCTAWTSSGAAEIASAPAGLGATIEENIFLCVSPSNRSPTIGGFVANYRVLDPTGGLVRTLSLPFTCADMGIEPDFGSTWIPDGATPVEYFISSNTLHVASRSTPYPIRLWNESPSDARLVFAFDAPTNGPSLFDSSLVTRHSSLVTTNTAPFAALNDDTTVYLDASCSNALATLSLTLSDPATNRTFLSESLSVKVVDTAIGEHWRVRSATDIISWDFSDAPEDVYAYLWRPNADSIFGDLVGFTLGKTPSLSLDLPPGDYLLDFYFPRVYDGVSSAAWSTNTLHIRPVPEFARDVVGVQCRTDRRVEVALTNDTFHSDIQWTLSPIVANGPRLFATSNSVAAATSMSGVSNAWVSAGTVPGVYQVTASYPGFTNVTATVFSIQAELDQMWETRNPANVVFNPTPKDDTSDEGYQETDLTNETTYGIHREKLYIASDSNDTYHISFLFSIIPVEATNLIVISGMSGDGLCTEKFRLNAPAINISFPSFSSGRALDSCKFRGAIEDADGKPFSNEEDEIVFSVYEHPTTGAPMEPGLVGINQARLVWHNGKITSLINHVVDPVPATSLMPHARALLTIFYDGNTNRVAPFLCPSSERTVLINAFGNVFEGSDCYSEWLTHNSGANFNSQGFASIKEYSWATNSEMSRFLALHKPFVLKKRHVNALDGYYETQTDTGTSLKAFYLSHVVPEARSYLINSNNLSTVTLPIDGTGYPFPNANSTLFSSSSPAWVPGTTFLAGDGGSSKAGAWGALIEEFFLNDDAFAEFETTGTVGRGRLFAPSYQFVIQRIDNQSAPNGFQCKTLAVRFSCRVEDLYDFNYEDSELASHAAALQIQRGNGTGGMHGIIFKDVFHIDYTYENPFEMESGASIHSVGDEMR